MRLNPFGVRWIHDRLTGRTDSDRLGHVAVTRLRHPSHLSEEEENVFSGFDDERLTYFWREVRNVRLFAVQSTPRDE